MAYTLKKLMLSMQRGEMLLPVLKAHLLKVQDQHKAECHDSKLSIMTFQRRLADRADTDPRIDTYFHPSAIGQCVRKLWFRKMNAPLNPAQGGDDLLKQHIVFQFGTYAHIMFQNLCSAAGVLAYREVKVVDDANKIIGHMDGILRLNGERPMLEIKTSNDRGYSYITEPKKEHVWQATIYNALKGLKKTIFVYLNKDSAAAKEYDVDFDEGLWLKTLKPRIAGHHEAVRKRKMPEREAEGQYKYPCTFCEYSHICWSPLDLKKWGAKAKCSV